MEEHGSRDIHVTICNAINYCNFKVLSPLLETLPAKILYLEGLLVVL